MKRAAGANHVVPYLTQSALRDVQYVAGLQANWDGAGSERPRPSSIANASARLPELCKMAMVAGRWKAPHVSASEAGEVTFEWWEDERKLIIYFGDAHMEALRVWGADMESEMDHVQAHRTEELASAWAWLNGN
jgi:hypothetical protein